ncbi:MAG: hypothetical protein K6A63_02005, partial [Acholeplasmatales bacterium]|nr:hypothetical protein [Acholeplasmatales bacterium]
MYIPHNDYELLYLYKEGNERALDILFYKYEHLIETVVNDYMPYGDSRPDMVQEGRIILFNCIKSFNEYIGVTFYSYFVIALRRKLYKLAKDNY